MSDVISGREFSILLCKAFGLEPNKVRRIILDASAHKPIIAYVEMFGDKRLLEINQTPDGYDFKVVNVEDVKT